jgi:hypothetical protein
MRQVVETLNGYGFAVQRVTVPGPPVNGGPPEDVPLTILSFVSSHEPHRVDVPLEEDARRQLVEALTGGITIARGPQG